ncbi:MAG: ribosomal RNA small subunit methyltransferase A [Anaerolineae bacterium]|nr:ribosomal RNA small subunit methyltransferase A [Anaerolineae bacterium]
MTGDPRALLRHYGLTPRKSLGQNFLVDPAVPARIAAQASLTRDDTVLEVGAGLGTLTAALATQAGRVIAVETDPHLISILHQEMEAFENVAIVHGDILDLDPAALLDVAPAPVIPLWGTHFPHYHVVANLPYYITAAVLRHLLEAAVRPARMVVTVQREVAARMVAVPDEMSVLAVSVQFYGKPRIALRLKRGVFFPVPDVESAVVCIDLYETPPTPVADVAEFFRVVRAGFAQRRKQLRNTLAASLHLSPEDVVAALTSVDVDATRRAETLTLGEWGRVAGALRTLMARH